MSSSFLHAHPCARQLEAEEVPRCGGGPLLYIECTQQMAFGRLTRRETARSLRRSMAAPKSVSLAEPAASSTFSGFRSRKRIPCCLHASASSGKQLRCSHQVVTACACLLTWHVLDMCGWGKHLRMQMIQSEQDGQHDTLNQSGFRQRPSAADTAEQIALRMTACKQFISVSSALVHQLERTTIREVWAAVRAYPCAILFNEHHVLTILKRAVLQWLQRLLQLDENNSR